MWVGVGALAFIFSKMLLNINSSILQYIWCLIYSVAQRIISLGYLKTALQGKHLLGVANFHCKTSHTSSVQRTSALLWGIPMLSPQLLHEHTWWCLKHNTASRVSSESSVTWPNYRTLEDIRWLEQSHVLSRILKITLFVKVCGISYYLFIHRGQCNHHSSAIISTIQDVFITLKRCTITNSCHSVLPILPLRNSLIYFLVSTIFFHFRHFFKC